METVAIVGVGLIGASFGLALRKAGFAGEIIGVSSDAAIAGGLKRGAISSAASLEKAAQTADLVYLAQPVDRILETISLLAPFLRAGTLVTDAGSTKEQIVARAFAHLPAGSFLGGHPIAGKEQRGPEAADADLFRDHLYVLTPARTSDSLTHNKGEQAFRQTLDSLGARVMEMSPQEHDHTMAFTSHLPQLLSTALAATLARDGDTAVSQVFGTGLLDMTRLALSSPQLWDSILSSNKTQVGEAVDSLVKVLMELKANLGECEIAHTFDQAALFASTIRQLPSSKK
jgi:prephenate dehydrogenase